MNESATNAPVPSKFIFLHEVASQPPATKVRVIGCVVQYDTAKGQVLLEHAYPQNSQPTPQIFVDVTLVLESTESSTFRPGTWVNVIGYTQSSHLRAQKKRKSNSVPQHTSRKVCLQAVLVWDAGSFRIRDFESTLEEQRLVQMHLNSDSK